MKVAVLGAGETGIIAALEAEGVDFYDAATSDKVGETERQLAEECGIHLHIIDPTTFGAYDIARAVNSAMSSDKISLLHALGESDQLAAVSGMVQDLGGLVGNGPDLTWIVEYFKDMQAAMSKRHVVKAYEAIGEKARRYIKIRNGDSMKGVPAVVKFTLQSDPVSEVGENGCQARDMLEYVLRLFVSLDEAFPCKEGGITIRKLKEALRWQDAKQ